MPVNPSILLFDTNVWLDLFLPHRPNRDIVLDLLDESQARNVTLVYPARAVLDVYQKVRSDNKRWVRESRALTQTDAVTIKRMAWDYVTLMQEIGSAIPVDANDLALACKYRDVHDDLEDDLVLAACRRARANYLVTSDTVLASHAPIETKTPARMLELLRSGRAKGTPASQNAARESDWLYRWLSEREPS